MIKGIDVSSYQGEIDFEQVKQAGNEFVIIRAGWGNSTVNTDRFFERNYAAAKAAGLFVGAYWYSYADSISGAFDEATACMNVIAGKQFELPIFYDVEEPFQRLCKRRPDDCRQGLLLHKLPRNHQKCGFKRLWRSDFPAQADNRGCA